MKSTRLRTSNRCAGKMEMRLDFPMVVVRHTLRARNWVTREQMGHGHQRGAGCFAITPAAHPESRRT